MGMKVFASARNVTAITQNDTTVQKYTAVYVGEAGNLKVTCGGTDVTFSGIAAGTILPVEVTKVFSTGSTAFTAGTLIGLTW